MTQGTRYALHCHQFGPEYGPPLLLLHGLGGGLVTWEPLVQTLDTNRRTIVPDLLGFGRSPHPRIKYSVEDHLEGLEALLDDLHLVGTRAHLVGFSLGAILALELAARRPETFGGVTLVGLPYFDDAQQARAHIARFGLLGRLGLALGEQRGASVLGEIIRLMRPLLLSTLPHLSGRLPANAVREALRHDFVAFSRSLRNVLVTHRPDEAIAGLSQRKVLVVHGERDRAAPINNVRQLVSGLPRWELMVVPDVGHNVPVQNPELLVDLLDSTRQSQGR